MKQRILIVEDQFVEADYLQLILTQADLSRLRHANPE